MTESSVILQGNLSCQRYYKQVLQRVVLHFDDYLLVLCPIFMNGNAQLCKTHAIREYLQNVTLLTLFYNLQEALVLTFIEHFCLYSVI